LLKRANYKDDKRLALLLNQFGQLDYAFEKYILPLIEKLENNKKEQQRFLELLVERYYTILWQSIDKLIFENTIKDKLLKSLLFLSEVNIKTLNKQTGNQSLYDYLVTKDDFIEVFNTPDELNDVIKLIKSLNIKFQKLELKRYDNNLIFDYISQNNYYILNVEMLYLMLFNRYNIDEFELKKLFYGQNFTTIVNSTDEALRNYIFSNFETYLNNIFLKLESKQAESEKAIDLLVEQLENDSKTLSKVLNKISTRILDLEEFGKSDKWNLLFETDRVGPTWKNLLTFFKLSKTPIDKTVTDWLNNKNICESITKNKLRKENFTEVYSPSISSLMLSIIENDRLEIYSYEKLVLSFPYIFPELSLDKLTLNKIQNLVRLKKIQFNTHHYNLLVSLNLSDELYDFTRLNISKFIEEYHTFDFDLELHRRLFGSNGVDLNNQKSLIKLVPIENIKDSKLSLLMGSILLSTKEELVEKEIIIAVVIQCTDTDLRLQLLNKYFDKFEFDKLDEVFNSIGGVYKQASVLRKRPIWKNTKINLLLAQKLKNIGYFVSFEIKEKKDQIRIVVRYS